MMKLEENLTSKAVTSKALIAKAERSLLCKLHPEAVTSKALTASGITLVALVVTVIVLLILAGISVSIVNDVILDKAVIASTKTNEESIKEKVEIAWMSAKASYFSDKKQEAFNQKLKRLLEKTPGMSEVSVMNNESSTTISFSYENQPYNFSVSPSGEILERKLLKGNVKVGDYVAYPKEYTGWYDGTVYPETNGWRVIDDGVMNGSSGYVKIISTGIPARWSYKSDDYDGSIVDAMDDLRNNFINLTFVGKSLQSKIDMTPFKIEPLAYKISTVTLEDINLIEDNYGLFHYNSSGMNNYWIASTNETGDEFYYMSNSGIEANNVSYRTGVRPVIYLGPDLMGDFDGSNIWKNIK